MKETIENILVNYGVAFTDSLSDTLIITFKSMAIVALGEPYSASDLSAQIQHDKDIKAIKEM